MPLILKGTLQSCTQIGGGTNKKTGEVYPVREMVQLMDMNSNGLATLYTFQVPDKSLWEDKVGQEVSVPVRAWVNGKVVSYAFAG